MSEQNEATPFDDTAAETHVVELPPVPPYELFDKTGSRTDFRNHPEIKAGKQTFNIPYEMVKPRPGFNIRTEENEGFSVASLMELAEQIQHNGLTPITGDLSKDGLTFYIEDGERRWRAIGMLRSNGEAFDMIEVYPNAVSKTEKERLVSMLSSNNKVPYRPIEIAEGIYRLKKFFEMSNDEIGKSLSKSRQWVDNMIKLSQKPEDVKEQVRIGSITPTQAIQAPAKRNSHNEDMVGIVGKSKIPTTKDRTIGGGSGSDMMNDVEPEKELTEMEKVLKNIAKVLGKIESLSGGLNDQAKGDFDNYQKWIRNDLDTLNIFFSKKENRDSSRFITVEAVNQLVKLVDTDRISDGYHTFKELYEHRIELFIALCAQHIEPNGFGSTDPAHEVWRSRTHSDGTAFPGWFVLGIFEKAGEQITYHLPDSYWDRLNDVPTRVKAPEYDGHTPADVIERLKTLQSQVLSQSLEQS